MTTNLRFGQLMVRDSLVRVLAQGCAGALLASAMAAGAAAPAEASPRERVSFNADWRFVKGDPAEGQAKLDYPTLKPFLVATGPEFSVNTPPAARPEGNPGAEAACAQPGFDDSNWRKLNLPHDWGVEGPFQQELPGETGKLPWSGVAWYRKHFTFAPQDQGKQVYLDIDGAMAYASVWLNGQFVGGWPYGYASWELDLTSYLKPGGDNVLAIRLIIRRSRRGGIRAAAFIATFGW